MATEADRRNYRSWYERNKEAYRPRKAALMRKYRAEHPEKYRQWYEQFGGC